MGSRSYSSNVTEIRDDRLITGEGSVGLTGQGNALSIADNSTTIFTDQGAIAGAVDIVKSSLATVEGSSALAARGFEGVLDLAGSLFAKNFSAIETNQTAVASAYQTAKELQGSSFDQKTIVLLAVAGCVVLFLVMKGRT